MFQQAYWLLQGYLTMSSILEISLDTRVQRNVEVFSANVGEDLVVFDHTEGKYYGSGPVGDAIWTLIEEEIAATEICNALLEKFDVDRQTCEAEVLGYLGQLNANSFCV